MSESRVSDAASYVHELMDTRRDMTWPLAISISSRKFLVSTRDINAEFRRRKEARARKNTKTYGFKYCY
jgi:hypothetical protein